MAASSIFKHPGVKAFFLYFVASQINDPLSVNFGGLPVTPLQISIMLGVGMTIKYWSAFVYEKLSLFYLFLLMIFFYTLIKVLSEGQAELYFVSLAFNLLWVTCVSSSLIKIPLKKGDYLVILKGMLWCLLPSVLFGAYEFLAGKYLFPEGLGGAMKVGVDDNNFYVRGGFRDKFDFSSFMFFAPAAFLSLYLNDIKTSIWFKLISLLATFLILVSYSSSCIISLGVVIIYALFFKSNVRKTLPLVIGLGCLVIVSTTYFLQSDIYKSQSASYSLKYQRQIEDKDESNFRWIAFKVGMEHFLDKPVFGNGLDKSKDVIFKYAPNISRKPTNSHNYIINNLLDFGLLGFLIISFALIGIFKFYLKTDKFHGVIKPVSLFLQLLFIFNLITFQTYYHEFGRSTYFILIFLVFVYFSQKLGNESTRVRA